MADPVLYRAVQGEGISITEDAAAKTATFAVPGLSGKLNVGDIGQASHVLAGIVQLATNAEVQSGADDAKAVTPAGLGAAMQATAYDTTVGRLLKVGAFGLGGGINSVFGADLNLERPAGFYYFGGGGANFPAGVADVWLINLDHSTAGTTAQIAQHAGDSRLYFRRQQSGVWSPWFEIFTAANFDPASKANTSGAYAGITSGDSSRVGGQLATDLAPPGMIGHFAGQNPPAGWLAANGAAVSRATYPALFAQLGTIYGAGNGSSTFNLPDMRGLFMRAQDAGRGVDPAGSRPVGNLQGSDNVSHSHAITVATISGHTHTGGTDFLAAHSHSGSTDNPGDHVHSPLYAQSSGSDNGNAGTFVEVSPSEPLGVVAFNASSTAPGGAHTHALTLGPAGAHSHALSMNPAGDHTHFASAQSVGDVESRPINMSLLACIKT